VQKGRTEATSVSKLGRERRRRCVGSKDGSDCGRPRLRVAPSGGALPSLHTASMRGGPGGASIERGGDGVDPCVVNGKAAGRRSARDGDVVDGTEAGNAPRVVGIRDDVSSPGRMRWWGATAEGGEAHRI